MSENLTPEQPTVDRPAFAVEAISGVHVLVADSDASTRGARERQLLAAGHRVSVARTAFEAIVKASCHVPDLILLDPSLTDMEASEVRVFLASCPLTSHIPIVRLSARRLVPERVLADIRRRARL